MELGTYFQEYIKEICTVIAGDNYFEEVKKSSSLIGSSRLYNNLVSSVIENISNIMMDPLIKEYHLYKDSGKNSGKTLMERSNQFIKHMMKEEELFVFIEKYPVLLKKIESELKHRKYLITNVCNLYLKDKESIREKLGISLGKIDNIHLSMGDKHSGMSVGMLESKIGKVVFKPRTSEIDKFVYDLVELVNNYLYPQKTTFKFSLSLDCANYSWQEYITHETCKTLKEAQEFYYKSGIYLAIFLVLGTSDLHFENLIAHGADPIFIDLETLSTGQQGNDFDNFGFKIINNSVINTMLLPRIDNSDVFDINLSGLFSFEQDSESLEQYILAIDEENEWIYKNKHYKFTPTNNVVTINNEKIDIKDVIDDLLAGFKDASIAIINNKEHIISYVQSRLEKNLVIRQVLRPTKVYARFLDATLSTKYLSSNELTSNLFNILRNTFEPAEFGHSRVDKEISDLEQGNIPMFYALSNKKHLYSETQLICENYYIEPILNSIKRRINKFELSDIEYQSRLIKQSITTIFPVSEAIPFSHLSSAGYIINIENELETYVSTLKHHFFKVDEEKVDYYSLYVYGDHYKVDNSQFGLYDAGGLILFLVQYGLISDDNDSYRLGISLYSNLLEKFDLQKDELVFDLSVFSGITGLAYVAYNLYKITKTEKYLEDFKSIMNYVLKQSALFDDGIKLDYMTGLIGIVIMLLKIVRDNDYLNKIYEPMVIKLSNEVIKRENELNGFSLVHGKTGLINLYSQLFLNTYDKQYFEYATKYSLELIEYIENQAVNHDEQLYTWCNGVTGMYSALIDYQICTQDYISKEVSDSIDRLIMNNIELFLNISNYNLCHGLSGNYFILRKLLQAKKKSGNETIKKYIDMIKFPEISSIQWVKGSDLIIDSFMLGATGVAYTLLSKNCKEKNQYDLPSIIDLELF